MVRPEKELKAFARVQLSAGEQKKVVLKLDPSSFTYYDDVKNAWMRSAGGYELFIGTSSRNVVSAAKIK
jgi:beta-glucosidase